MSAEPIYFQLRYSKAVIYILSANWHLWKATGGRLLGIHGQLVFSTCNVYFIPVKLRLFRFLTAESTCPLFSIGLAPRWSLPGHWRYLFSSESSVLLLQLDNLRSQGPRTTLTNYRWRAGNYPVLPRRRDWVARSLHLLITFIKLSNCIALTRCSRMTNNAVVSPLLATAVESKTKLHSFRKQLRDCKSSGPHELRLDYW